MIQVFTPTFLTDANPTGLGLLHPYSAIVHDEVDGDYYVNIDCPINQQNILYEGAVLAITIQDGSIDYFRVSNIVKTGFRVTTQAKHVSRDCVNYLRYDYRVVQASATSCLAVFFPDRPLPFNFTTDIPDSEKITLTLENKTIWEIIEAIRQAFDAHLVCHGKNIHLTKTIGTDRGLKLSYGFNIKSFSLTEDWSSVCTKILPVGKDGLRVDDIYISSSTQYDIPYTKVVEFSNAETKSRLTTLANAYLKKHKNPKKNYTLDAYIDDKVVTVGDTVKVEYSPLNISFTSTIAVTEWNAVSKMYEKIEFGDKMKSIRGLYKKLGGSSE